MFRPPRRNLGGAKMLDTLVDVADTEIETRLKKINKLHPKLEFTLEKPIENTIPFLDMKIKQLEAIVRELKEKVQSDSRNRI